MKATQTSMPRGQILVLFAMLLTTLVGMSAFVVDIAWIWSHELRVQRAADAAALAGVVHLPGDATGAVASAHAESRKNGYRDGTGGVDVDPSQDGSNPRRMVVEVSAPVDTFFMRLFGINQVTVTRRAKAEYVLPVPMGSPQNYYGVGDFRRIAAGSVGNTGARPPTVSVTPVGWTTPNQAFTSNDVWATNNAGAYQQYSTFGLTVPAGYTVRGIEAVIEARSSDSAGCQIGLQLSWNNGTSWTSPELLRNLTGADVVSTVGGAANLWGRTWTPAEFSNANFRVRVHDVDPGGACDDTAMTQLDRLRIRVSYQAPAADSVGPVTSPTGGALSSQGFWGAVFTKGGVRQNGDRYSPQHYAGGSTALNPDYAPGGYDYTIEVGAGGQVHLFDATYCGVGPTAFGGNYGAGDHWTGRPSGGGSGIGPVTTRYRLFNTNGTEYNNTDDTQVADSGSTFANEYQTNQNGSMGSPQATSTSSPPAANCGNPAVEPYHNAWYQLASSLAAGKYRLNVQTSDPANNTIAAENLFSIHVTGGSNPRVYGGGRMAAYNNLEAGTQQFYLAQIEAVHAGKTLDITLFDPGDVSGDAYLRILSPDGNSYDYAVFDYAADAACSGSSDACSGTNRTQIRTHNSSGSAFDNSVLTISIPLPSTYGSTGLMPSGETEQGWWKIEYQVAGGNDTTTWEVTIRGNPVRLVVP